MYLRAADVSELTNPQYTCIPNEALHRRRKSDSDKRRQISRNEPGSHKFNIVSEPTRPCRILCAHLVPYDRVVGADLVQPSEQRQERVDDERDVRSEVTSNLSRHSTLDPGTTRVRELVWVDRSWPGGHSSLTQVGLCRWSGINLSHLLDSFALRVLAGKNSRAPEGWTT